jgi:ketosteroid isomerase-like protein
VASTEELVRRSLDAWNAEDLDALLACAHPDIQVDFSANPLFPGLEEVYRGHDGVRRWWATFTEPFEFIRVEPVRLVASADRAVALLHFEARGKSSGAAVDLQLVNRWTCADGLIVLYEGVPDFEAAVSEAGLDDG